MSGRRVGPAVPCSVSAACGFADGGPSPSDASYEVEDRRFGACRLRSRKRRKLRPYRLLARSKFGPRIETPMSVPTLELPEPLARQIREEGAAAYPNECCGILFGRDVAAGGVTRRVLEAIDPVPNEFEES